MIEGVGLLPYSEGLQILHTEYISPCIYTVPATMAKNCQENDSEKVKVIIGKMVQKADLTVRPVISAFDFTQSRSANIKRLDQFNVLILEKCAEFLGIPLADKQGSTGIPVKSRSRPKSAFFWNPGPGKNREIYRDFDRDYVLNFKI